MAHIEADQGTTISSDILCPNAAYTTYLSAKGSIEDILDSIGFREEYYIQVGFAEEDDYCDSISEEVIFSSPQRLPSATINEISKLLHPIGFRTMVTEPNDGDVESNSSDEGRNDDKE
ncbi:hypothetical protein H0H81_009431 [Sphagnurus paluster]|uniref:Uncharacterized protein n=1 Tax=Sphagnurus paluster TaxID=117069 RepID=A0A9P7FS32_9AGAR|nr:hypothetical protein H0H81_009431 [Sphagnurus paluster]